MFYYLSHVFSSASSKTSCRLVCRRFRVKTARFIAPGTRAEGTRNSSTRASKRARPKACPWVLPQINIPGRQMLYLVRDAAHPCHAVIGIAALSNCAMQMNDRDDLIGWTFDAFFERARAAVQAPDARVPVAPANNWRHDLADRSMFT